MQGGLSSVTYLVRELRELGLGGAWYRAQREARLHLGIEALIDRRVPDAERGIGRAQFNDDAVMGAWASRAPFSGPKDVAPLRARVAKEDLDALATRARDAMRGKIRCFSRWQADFGHPIDWHLNPLSGRRWSWIDHSSNILQNQGEVGDVKLTWEIGRFPHAYDFVRAATFGCVPAGLVAAALDTQIRSFASNNPYARGVHWSSGQEIAIRLMAFAFSVSGLARLEGAGVSPALPAFVARMAWGMAHHIEHQIEFAERAIYNNHLLAEGLGLALAGWMLPPCEAAARWWRVGNEILEEQADRQIYRDGAYIQQSHNYHRVALQYYLWAECLRRTRGQASPARWLGAMERSLDFLVAHQSPDGGELPNYGANDGALPCPLSSCRFADFRPTLQAISLMTRGERLYEAGPWDEEAAWFVGSRALDEAPFRAPSRRSVAFRDTGFFVLRGRDPRSFSAFRCGTIVDRFSQIDMLHLDVWWRGQNVLVDAGSYAYNASGAWHGHFMCTASHNTVQVDGLDQMLHFRQFKCLYWTEAKLLVFEDGEESAACAGEHEGFRRHLGECVHRRSVLFVKDDVWIVVDRVSGAGSHHVRLHWLAGAYPADYSASAGRMTLHTPEGDFSVTVLDEAGAPLAGTMVSGQETPPRGWFSRYYGEKVAVPSLAVERSGPMPMIMVSVLGAGVSEVGQRDRVWVVRAGATVTTFTVEDGIIVPQQVHGTLREDLRRPLS